MTKQATEAVTHPELQARIDHLRGEQARLRSCQDALAAEYRALAEELRAAGWANVEIAEALGISKQRAGQLLPPLRSRIGDR